MASQKILDFDFTEVIGFTVNQTTGLIENSGSGTIPQYTYNFNVSFIMDNGKNLIIQPHIEIEYHTYNDTTTRTMSSRDSYVDGIFYCGYESQILSTQPIIIDNVYCYGYADIYAPVNHDYQLLRIQKVDSQSLDSVALIRFYRDSQQTSWFNSIDLGQFISSLVRYPFNVTTGERANIMLGFAVLNDTLAPLITERYYSFTVFDDYINGYYRDNRDITHSEIILRLPFINDFILSSEYINKRIKIVYNVDILQNKANIVITHNDVIIAIVDCVVGSDLPYILKISYTSFSIEKNLKDYSLENIDNPQIIINQHLKNNDFYGVDFSGRINELASGTFVECNNFNIDNIPTESEFNMIKNLLETGVYI